MRIKRKPVTAASRSDLHVQFNVVDNDSWDIIDSFETQEDAIDCAKQNDLIVKGDRVVIVAGMPITEHTNSLRVFNV